MQSFSVLFLQSSVSRDPSEIILIFKFAAQETFLNMINFFFFFDEYRVQNNSIYLQ